MSRTFRDHELRNHLTRVRPADQRRRFMERREQRRLKGASDPFCTYLLGTLDEQGSHAQSADPADRAYAFAKSLMEGR